MRLILRVKIVHNLDIKVVKKGWVQAELHLLILSDKVSSPNFPSFYHSSWSKSITILYSTWNHLKTIAFPMISALMEINLFTSIRSGKIWRRSLNELWIMVWWRARFSFNAMASCFSAVSVMISCIILGVLLLSLQYHFISLHQNKKP